MKQEAFREESDSMGTVLIPVDAYYGPQTARAIENFPASGLRFQRSFIKALALLKKCAASVNGTLGIVPDNLAEAIGKAAGEVVDGMFEDQFRVDIFQTGSGTSTNMNMNEVIACRANEILTEKKAAKAPVHPNDHVNAGQSSNDVIPSAMHLSAADTIVNELLPAIEKLEKALAAKSDKFENIEKIGRTHLQDAVKMTLGNEFSGYARLMEQGRESMAKAIEYLSELALGGTAVGTGLNAHERFATNVIEILGRETGIPLRKAKNHFAAQSALSAVMETSGSLKTLASNLIKISNDIRWLSSGPRCGLGELTLPALQPGSSIMPGKINPVIPEAVIQMAAQVIGNDATITVSAQSGNFELNTMLPVTAYNLLQSISLLASACGMLAEKCVAGIRANRETCSSNVRKSLALATQLVPYTGYDKAAEIAKQAFKTGETIPEIVKKEKTVSDKVFKELFG